MSMANFKEICGRIPCKSTELNLSLTLLGGQSFRWVSNEVLGNFMGVAYDCFWILTQSDDYLHYKAVPSSGELTTQKCELILNKYFRLHVNLGEYYETWKTAHEHFRKAAKNCPAVRILDQDPVENVVSFICSQNNNIKRISSMIEFLSRNYGLKICTYEENEFYTFPSLKTLNNSELESRLRQAKFGYRAKFIANAVEKILRLGGKEWLESLRFVPYEKARDQLLQIPGIGPKVADCICLMSLNHLESIPVDTHIFKIAKEYYIPDLKKNTALSRKTYDDITTVLRSIYGKNAGWAQSVLFCSGLRSFNQVSQ